MSQSLVLRLIKTPNETAIFIQKQQTKNHYQQTIKDISIKSHAILSSLKISFRPNTEFVAGNEVSVWWQKKLFTSGEFTWEFFLE